MLQADGRSLLVVVDTNRPEQVEDQNLPGRLQQGGGHRSPQARRIHIQNADLMFRAYASSVCELMSEGPAGDRGTEDILRSEAEAMLAGIVLDTKNFTIRTGERHLRRGGLPAQGRRRHDGGQKAPAERHGAHRCAV